MALQLQEHRDGRTWIASIAPACGRCRRAPHAACGHRSERSQGRRPKLFAGLRKCALGDHGRQGHAATQGTEELIQPDLQRSAANHLEQECDQDICAQTTFAGEVRRADTMGCNKLRRAQQIADVFEDAGMDFEIFPYAQESHHRHRAQDDPEDIPDAQPAPALYRSR